MLSGILAVETDGDVCWEGKKSHIYSLDNAVQGLNSRTGWRHVVHENSTPLEELRGAPAYTFGGVAGQCGAYITHTRIGIVLTRFICEINLTHAFLDVTRCSYLTYVLVS